MKIKKRVPTIFLTIFLYKYMKILYIYILFLLLIFKIGNNHHQNNIINQLFLFI